VSIRTIRGGKITKVTTIARRTSITVTSPKLLIIGNGEDPASAIFEGLRRLESWGAELLAVPCNTAHIFIDRFRAELKIPLVHIVEETVARTQSANPDGAWLLATSGTSASGIYSAEAERRGYHLFTPDLKHRRYFRMS